MKKALTNLLSLSALVILASCGGQKADSSSSSSSFISSEPTTSVSLSSNETTSEESSSEPAMSSLDSQQSTSESKPVSSSSTPVISSASSSAPSYVNDQLSTSNGLVVKFNRNGLGASIDSISWNNKQIAKDGFVVGRCANRIANGKFSIDDKQYSVSINANPHSLHGGTGSGMNSWRGPFATKNWTKVEQTASSITYTIHSPDEENGYPGNMDMTVKYTLSEEGDLAIQYTATSDKDTLCNPTNHLFININGNNSYDNTDLEINADNYTPLTNQIPTGQIASVTNTKFDYRTSKAFDGNQDYDDNYVLNGTGYRQVATLTGRSSSLSVSVSTDRPGLQLYKAGNGSICLESQMFPDMINHPEFDAYGTTILRAGETFTSLTTYSFQTIE